MHGGARSRRSVLCAGGLLALLTGSASAIGGRSMSEPVTPTPGGPWTPLLGDPDAVIVAGTLLGERVRVLIDTGAAATIVDRPLAQRLGLKTEGIRSVRGDIGSVTLDAGGDLTIQVGGAKVTARRFMVTDLSPIFGAAGGAPNLIMGADALRDVVLEIDFPARRLALWPRLSFAPPPGTERFTVTKSVRGQLAISIALERHAAVAAALDLGSSNPLTVSPGLAEAQGLLQGRQVSSAATGGVDGISISRTVSVATLQVGQSLLKDIPCEVLAKTDATLVPAKLGLPVLERYLFALDVTGSMLWLQPAQRQLGAPFRRDLSGLGLAIEADRLRVVHVAKGGPAALAGWRDGETIAAVNGMAIGPDYVAGGLAQWRYGPVGTKVVLSMGDGSKRTIVLQRYY
jgi:predicted aspartyl protease